MNSFRHLLTTTGRALALGAPALLILLLSAPQACAQERPDLRQPDSLRVKREAFFTPSFGAADSLFLSGQLSLDEQTSFGPPELFNADNTAWKRAFLTGAAADKADIFHPYRTAFKKAGWFRNVQVVLGTAQLAGAAYLAYRAIKKKPVTKK